MTRPHVQLGCLECEVVFVVRGAAPGEFVPCPCCGQYVEAPGAGRPGQAVAYEARAEVTA